MVDDAAGIGVLVVDPDWEPVDRAVQISARITHPRSFVLGSFIPGLLIKVHLRHQKVELSGRHLRDAET